MSLDCLQIPASLKNFVLYWLQNPLKSDKNNQKRKIHQQGRQGNKRIKKGKIGK